MTIPTTLVTGAFPLPNAAAPPAGSRIVFALSGYDMDGDLIVPGEVIAPFSESGQIEVELWPNTRGTRNTHYRVTLYLGTSTRNVFELGDIIVPHFSPVNLVTLLNGYEAPEIVWLLATGAWNDAGVWDDTAIWTEAA